MNRINILEYLEETAREVPEKIAFSTGTESRTFGEVLEGSRVIGTNLLKSGYHGEPVVVLMEKHPDTVITFLGAITAGCYYVCLDGSMPLSRMELILSSLRPRILVTDAKNAKNAEALRVSALEKGIALTVVSSDAIREGEEDAPLLMQARERQLDTDPIYVVFTSGSTGVPKGVIACHRSVIDYTENLCLALGFSRDTVFGNQSPLFFDAPLKELMPTLKYGATTYFIPKVNFMFPVRLVEYLNTYCINTVCWVVSARVQISQLGALERVKPEYLTTVAFGSEVFPRRQYDLWREALPNARFFNLYGPTEATGMSCYWEARPLDADEPIPIGKPFRNTGILLLTDDGREAEDGEEGEICIRGTCLTMGYFREREKTDAVFTENPLQTAYRELIYRTGDIGVRNEHGELVFRSRKDYQIKLMGRRIELGEIEAVAADCDGVGRACCTFDETKQRITLFYVGTIDEPGVTAYLKTRLPSYMIPYKMLRIDAMPHTPNGKLDRRALKERAEELS